MCMMMMNNNRVEFDMDMAVEAVMAIMDKKTRENKIEAPAPVAGKMVTYDGYGTVIEIDGEKTHKGKQAKRGKRAKNGKDSLRDMLNEACEDFLRGCTAFEGKVYTNTKDGIVIRMADADYTVKAGGHAACEFDVTEEGFRAEKSFTSRGTAVNHAGAIAKLITSEIENQKSDCSFAAIGNENSKPVVCVAKPSGIRLQVDGAEFTIKISKKRARCIVDLG